MIGDRLLGIPVLAFGMREQLHGQDVGVAVDDAARQRRARIGNDGGALDEPGNEVPDHGDKSSEPRQERPEQPRVELEENDRRADPIDRDEPQRIDDLHHGLAQRGAVLDDLVRNPAREVVLEE